MVQVMNQIGSGPNGEESGKAFAREIGERVRSHFENQRYMNKEQLKQ